MGFGRSSFWTLGGMDSHHDNTMPSPSADVLLSPVSPFSDVKHTYSPGPDCSPNLGGGATSYTMSPGAMKISLSPRLVPPTPRSVIRQQSGSAAIQSAFGNPTTPGEPFHMGNMVDQSDDVTMFGSEQLYSHSQGRSPGMAPWYTSGSMGEEAAHSPQQQQSDKPPFDPRPNSFLASPDRNSRQRQAQWSNKSDVPTQNHFQSRFMTPLTDNEKAQRTKDDETLLQMKQDGYTYKDIRKALGRKVAESTLRGRYRSLTKPRNHRVRAPKWSEIDVGMPRSAGRLSR